MLKPFKMLWLAPLCALSGCTPVADTPPPVPTPIAAKATPQKPQVAARPTTGADKPATTTASKPGTSKTRTLAGGLKIEDVTIGSGATVKSGDTITVNYRGTLQDGTQFDSSYDRGQPATFRLGEVIEGWNIGLVGMREGGKRKLTIPGPLAYGPNPPTSSIPPDATLLFDVELVRVG